MFTNAASYLTLAIAWLGKLTKNPMASSANTAVNFWIIGDPIATIIENIIYGARVALTPGKQNRFMKTLYGLLGIAGLTIAAIVLGILAALGIKVAIFAAPFFPLVIAIIFFARWIHKYWRARTGLDQQKLLVQKEEKVELAEKVNQNRWERFLIESFALNYLLTTMRAGYFTEQDFLTALNQKIEDYQK